MSEPSRNVAATAQTSTPHEDAGAKDRSSLVVAAACGAVSSLGYTLTNICLRSLTEVDPVWVSQMKTIPTILGVLPLVSYRVVTGKPTLVNRRILLVVMLGALIGQVGGNIAFQVCLGVIGIALAVPITMGSMIVNGALLGRLLLKDPISRPIAIASTVLMTAILVLTFGSPQASSSLLPEGTEADILSVSLGVAAAVCAGFGYSALGVSIRYATNRGASITSVLLVVGLVGFVILGAWVHDRYGLAIWTSTSRPQYVRLVGAGIFNVIAFAALSKSLQLSSIMFVNAINATQIAMAAIAGVALFGEPITAPLVMGILLTTLGLQMMRARGATSAEPAPDKSAPDKSASANGDEH